MPSLEPRFPPIRRIERLLQRCAGVEFMDIEDRPVFNNSFDQLEHPELEAISNLLRRLGDRVDNRASAVIMALELLLFLLQGREIVPHPHPEASLEPVWAILEHSELNPMEPPIDDINTVMNENMDTNLDRNIFPPSWISIYELENLGQAEWWDSMGDNGSVACPATETFYQIAFTYASLSSELHAPNTFVLLAERVANAASVYSETMARRAAFSDDSVIPPVYPNEGSPSWDAIMASNYHRFIELWWSVVVCKFSYV